MPHKLMLIDGSAFLFRSYFSTLSQNLTNQNGFPTGAMFGVINAIKRLQKQYAQAKIVAIFDAKGKNFRHDIYPKYKANRKPTDNNLIMQIEPLYEIIQAMGLRFICVPGVEADDVIATLSRYAQQHNINTIIASNDKDLMQLVGTNVSQLDMKGVLYDSDAVTKKMGVAPKQILDLLALAGDSTDNIPGIPSVGLKTAAQWLQTYNNIAGIKANAIKIKGKVGDKLRDNFALLDLSYQLAALKFYVTLPCDILQKEPEQSNAKLAKLYQKYDFSKWLRELGDTHLTTKPNINKITPTNVPPQINVITTDISSTLKDYSQTLVLDLPTFKTMIKHLKQTKKFVFDLETTSLNYMDAAIVGWVFLVDKDSFYLPVGHDYLNAPKQLNFNQVMNALKPILEDMSIGKIGQNLKYDAHVLANYQIELNAISDDTMVKSYCLNSVASRHNMDDLSEHYLQHKTIHFADIAGTGKKQIGFNQVNLDLAFEYACEDVIVTHLLNQVLEENIAQYPKLVKLYQTIELSLIKVLLRMERNGVKLDVSSLNAQQLDITVQMNDIKSQAFTIAGNQFNFDSPKQIQQILFSEDGLNLTPKKKTPKGVPSTNEEALQLLDHPLVSLILNYRTLTKLNSTYLQALPKQINTTTKRLHTSYHQAVTTTGRLSSTNPNLQNIPIRSEQGVRIRGAFVAAKSNIIIAADYSQIELRIMAHISKDKHLLEAFKQGQDVHGATASNVFNVPIDKITKEHRRRAKAINFGLIYGMSAFGLAKQINVSRTEAKDYINAYFDNYPGVRAFMDSIQESAKVRGYVTTIMGRRLYLPQINASNKLLQQHAIRMAINAPMQGSSADIIKQAMLNIDKWIGKDNPSIKLLMQVHDELVFEVSQTKADEFANKIKHLMENAYTLDIPLKVDVGIGSSWQQAH